jgi:drug/metabolite transporter (DMT)-like permease
MERTFAGLVFTFLSGSAGALYSLNYKFKERNAYPTDPVMFFFALIFVLVTTVFRILFREPIYSREALLLGIPFGASMYLALRLFFLVARRSKLNISWLIIQFSLLVPFGLSILIYRETLELQAILGIVLIFSSIVFFAVGKGSSAHGAAVPDARTWVLLALSSLFSGIGLSMPRIYVALSQSGGAFTLAFYQGLTLVILSAGGLLLGWNRSRGKRTGGILLVALSMGVTAVPANAFITMAVKYLRGAIVYPLRSVVNILCVFILSFLVFKERVRPLEAVGSGLAVVGIVLVSATISR